MLCVECGKKKIYNETFIKLPSKIHRLCEDCLEEYVLKLKEEDDE